MRSHWGFCVVGAGNGGCAMAVDLALRGFPVTLYSSDKGKLDEIERLGLTVEGAIEGSVRCMKLTNSPEEAAELARVIMVVVPAFVHSAAAERFAPYLGDSHIVVLNPGRTLGAVEFEHVLRENGCLAQVVVAEAQSLLYASRIVGPGRVRVFSVKRRVEVAALPSWRTQEVVKVLNQAWPQFVAAGNLLETSLDNIGAILHPTPTILNVSRIEAGDPFDYYHEGVSPTVAHLLGCLDAERLAVARSLGVRARSLAKWLEDAYGSTGSDLYEAIRNTGAYSGIKAPREVKTRYILEDVPTGLVPMSALGKLSGVRTPLMDSVVELASHIVGQDFWTSGRTLENLGLNGMAPDDFSAYVREGREGASA